MCIRDRGPSAPTVAADVDESPVTGPLKPRLKTNNSSLGEMQDSNAANKPPANGAPQKESQSTEDEGK